jgi:hypothetical protein
MTSPSRIWEWFIHLPNPLVANPNLKHPKGNVNFMRNRILKN